MSNSFRDAVKSVMEGAKEKTSDGMTPDAKNFRHDLHKVQDAGFKHMVQKDSETKDYEKMFKPSIDKMPTRLSDVEPDEGVNKYVEYNEAKMHPKGCSCDRCMTKEDKADEKEAAKSDKKIAEDAAPQGMSLNTFYKKNQNNPATNKFNPAPVKQQGAGGGDRLGSAVGATQAAKTAPKPYAGIGAMGGQGTAAAIAAKGTTAVATGGAKSVPAQAPAGAPDKASSGPALKPAQAPAGAPDKASSGPAAKPAAKPTPAPSFKQAFAAARAAAGGGQGQFTFKGKQYQTNVSGEKYVAPAKQKPVSLNQSYDIEVNGQTYSISEAHAAAIAAYVEKYGEVNEKSDPNVGKFISKEMEHPEKLTAQGKKQKIKQAIAIYYSKKRHGEKP